MTQREVTIRISAVDNFSDVARKYQRAMRDNADASEQSARRTRGIFSSMGQEIQGALAGVTVGAAFQVIGSLNEMGMTARQQGAIFKQVVAEMGISTEEMLARLRTATRGVLDDTSLMEGANFLKRMNLAESAEEMEDLVGMIMALKKPTDDATAAMEQFGLMISNQSLLRLDSFGLSSVRVKARMDELIDTLGREEAFRVATFEEMRVQVERLGPAVDASTSSFQRMGVRIQNTLGDIAEFVAGGLEAGAQIVELGTLALGQLAQKGNQRREEYRTQLREARQFAEAMAGTFGNTPIYRQDPAKPLPGTDQSLTPIRHDTTEFFREITLAVEHYTDLTGRAAETTDDLLTAIMHYRNISFVPTDSEMAALEAYLERREEVATTLEREIELSERRALNEQRQAQYIQANALMAQQDAARRREMLASTGRLIPFVAQVRADERIAEREAELAARAEAQERAAREAGLEAQREVQRVWSMMQRERAAERHAALAASPFGQQVAEAERMLGVLQNFQLRTTMTGSGAIISDQEVTRMEYAETLIQGVVSILEQGAEARLVPQEVVDRAGMVQDRLARMADSARETAEQTARILSSLEGVFGLLGDRTPMQQLTGDITNEVAERMRAAGVDPSRIDAFNRAAGFASGTRNEASDLFERKVTPHLAQIENDFGPQEAVDASVRAAERFTEMVERGLSPRDMAAAIERELYSGRLTGFRNIGGDGATLGGYTVRPNEGHDAVARGLGMTRDELYARGILRPDQMIHPGQTFGGSSAGRLVPLPGSGNFVGAVPTIGPSPLLLPGSDSKYTSISGGGPIWGPLPLTNNPTIGAPPPGGGLDTTATAMQGIADDTETTATASARWQESIGAVESAIPGVSTGAGKLASHSKDAADQLGRFKDYIDDVSGKVHVVKLKMEADVEELPHWMYDLLRRGLAELMANDDGRVGGGEPGRAYKVGSK